MTNEICECRHTKREHQESVKGDNKGVYLTKCHHWIEMKGFCSCKKFKPQSQDFTPRYKNQREDKVFAERLVKNPNPDNTQQTKVGCGEVQHNIFGEPICGKTKIGESIFLCRECSKELMNNG